jgi:transcriptional regulator with XRE-family HTH domain
LDISQPYYSRVEKGEVDIHISLVIKIAELYEISIERLLYSDLEEESKKKLH